MTTNPVLANGEIALVDKNNGVGEKLWVLRIGDGTSHFDTLPETAYALRSDLTAALNDISSLSDDLGDLAEELGKLELSVTTISTAVSTEETTRQNQVNALSAEISSKVKIEGVPTDYINISRVDAETYHQIVAGGTADAKTVYIVSSDNINAFGERVINVGDAVDLSDAVNLKQLNAVETSLTTTISSISSDLKDLIDGATGDASGLVGQVSAVLTGIINDTSSDITGMVDAVSDVVDTLSTDLYDLSGKVESLDDSLSDYVVDVEALGRTGDVFKYQLKQGG